MSRRLFQQPVSAAGITGVPGMSFIAALTSPYSYAAWFVAAWVIIGIVMLFVLRAKNPTAIAAVAHVHFEDEDNLESVVAPEL
jgi:amino acid transporter